MRAENILLIIDMQNDFCQPAGTLYVEGAERDIINLNRFIQVNDNVLDNIVLTQDTHHVLDISHSTFWKDENGNKPTPFTTITEQDILTGKWIPKYYPEESIRYIQALYKQGEFPHVIWPEHCIVGSEGAAIENSVMRSVCTWARTGRFFQVVQKGLNPLTEHFGALRANVPVENDLSTGLNTQLIEQLAGFTNIFIAGEAKSHCVANTIKQLLELGNLKNNLILLEDTMSCVPGFETLADPIYKEAAQKGIKFANAKDLILK